jgi:hypothetical protein
MLRLKVSSEHFQNEDAHETIALRVGKQARTQTGMRGSIVGGTGGERKVYSPQRGP